LAPKPFSAVIAQRVVVGAYSFGAVAIAFAATSNGSAQHTKCTWKPNALGSGRHDIVTS
jgi:hypothetical protein